MKAPKKFGAFIFFQYIRSMKKLLIFLLLTFVGYGQYCPTLGPDQILPCGIGSTTLTADLSQCGTGALPKQTTTYTVGSIPYATQTNTGTQLFMGDDTQQGPFNIGFTFCFFGQTYTQFWIGSNGWISFSPGQPTTFTTQTIPTGNALVPKNCIMGPWQDWHPGIGGQIRYQTSGVAPCRKLTVSWTNMPMFSCTGNQGTFHIVIYESTNNIENYIQNKPACLQWQGGTATEGVHNAAGTVGITVPGRNSTAWTATNDAWKWTPSGPTVNPTLTWYQVGNPVAIGTGPTITVNPIGPTQYTCHLTYPTCNAGWSACNGGTGLGPDTVLVVPGPPIPTTGPINGVDTICYLSSYEMYDVPAVAGYNYLWSSVSPITSGQGTNIITVDFSSFPGGFIPGGIQVTPEANGCIGAPVTIDLFILNVVPTIDPIGPFCEYDEFVTLNVNPIGGILSGIGVVGNEFYPSNAIGTNDINYEYTLSGCTFDTTTTVTVYPQPTLDSIAPYNPFYELCEGDSIVTLFTALSNLPGYNEWSFMGVTYQQDDLTVAFDTEGMFPLSVIHYSNGCASPQQQTVITVVVCPELLFYIPNSFTPDDNEHNQTWLPVFTTGIDVYDYRVTVYNRWGECVFESQDATKGWDGTYDNRKCQDGTYAYDINFGVTETSYQYTVRGHFTLIR
jgi:gliding motility-associated-like protein